MNKPNLYTLKRAIAVRLFRRDGTPFNVNVTHFIGVCTCADAANARIRVTEIGWDKAKPELHVIGGPTSVLNDVTSGPVEVIVKLDNVDARQELSEHK